MRQPWPIRVDVPANERLAVEHQAAWYAPALR
jgi:hypothetical protein